MKNGFSLLLTVLIISIVLSVGLSAGSIVINQIKLSGTGRDSQIAFYAADAGIECALYWDIKEDAFAPTKTSSITCAGNSFTVGGPSGQSNFTLNFDNGSCADVSVKKNSEVVIIESLAKNQCPPTERSVERGIEVTY